MLERQRQEQQELRALEQAQELLGQQQEPELQQVPVRQLLECLLLELLELQELQQRLVQPERQRQV